jgi:hypothetical protein
LLAFFLSAVVPVRAAVADQSVATKAAPDVKGPSLTAVLLDADKKARSKSLTVAVKVAGIKLVDPDSVGGKPHFGQGHLHYRLDQGPTVATTATKLSYHGLASGPHMVTVLLAGNGHEPLGPSATLSVMIP